MLDTAAGTDNMFSMVAVSSPTGSGSAARGLASSPLAKALDSRLVEALGRGAVFLGGSPPRENQPASLSVGLRAMDEALPDGGLPRGAVIEVSSPRGLGRATTVLLSACASAQAEARLRAVGSTSTPGSWCAWLDPSGTLSAGGAAARGVDLRRLLLVRPPWSGLAKVAVRVVESRIFSVVVVDTVCTPGLAEHSSPPGWSRNTVRLDRWSNVVRRLALAVEGSDTTVLLMTDRLAHRAMPLPVAMRLELDRRREHDRATTSFRVAKDRHGRIGGAVHWQDAATASVG